MTSKMDDVLSALNDRLTAVELTTVMIFDGPPVGDFAAGDYIFLGDDADPDTDAESVFEQYWVDLAQTRREEMGEIPCAVVSDTGSTDIRVARAQAFSVFAVCESMLVADQTLNGVVYTSELVSGSARPIQNERGSAVVVPFTIRYRAAV
jgi:hypothetical protein